ncbi:THUMP-like domain-containing protein [Eisenibacter elegans]|jgi:hypothetical protein|uniref:THUMP-like domain-containing protein n=1 Tax=Eisenibacter elegans TaxID=997 RepID=UPI0003F8389A|nr:hypothetical protein [Eisenibacter elegans]
MDMDALLTAEVQALCQQYLNEDPAQLMLKKPPVAPALWKAVVKQIQARQKVKHKLPDWYAHPQVIYPAALSSEQASSQATASLKLNLLTHSSSPILVDKQTTAADLTGGLGVDTWHWASAFQTVHYVEQMADIAVCAQHNFRVFHKNNIQVHAQTAEDFLAQYEGMLDFCYLDPARRNQTARKVFRWQDCQPDLVELLPLLLQKSRLTLVKASPILDITQATASLIQAGAHIRAVWVVSLMNEVKELLIAFGASPAEQPWEITCVDLYDDGSTRHQYQFDPLAEPDIAVNYSEPKTYIFEPMPAILKAGAFKSVANAWGLTKLHPNSHLYTADTFEFRSGFPGRIFTLEAVTKYQKKSVRAFLSDDKAHIATRNFPDTAVKVRQKLGLRDGGAYYLFATTLLDKQPAILICKKSPAFEDD